MAISSTPIVSMQKLDDGNFILSGQFVFATLTQLLEQQVSFTDNDSKDGVVSIDCTAVSHLDSAGIALLLEWKKEALLQNKELVFRKLPKQAKAIISAAHLNEIFMTDS